MMQAQACALQLSVLKAMVLKAMIIKNAGNIAVLAAAVAMEGGTASAATHTQGVHQRRLAGAAAEPFGN